MKIGTRIGILSFALLFCGALAFAQPAGGGGRSPGPGGGRTPPSRPAPPPKPKKPNSGNKKSTQSFNGMRQSTTHDPFQVVLIESKEESLRVTFNIPVDPKSFARENIFINGSPLEQATEIKFNKTGKLLEIKISLFRGKNSTLEFKNAKSFDGETLTVTSFSDLLPGIKQEYPKIKAENETDSKQKS